jgi:hypothetical protein
MVVLALTPFAIAAAKTAAVGAVANSAAHIIATPSDQLSASSTLKAAGIGATTSLASTGIGVAAGAALKACANAGQIAKAVQIANKVMDPRVVKVAAKAAAKLGAAAKTYPGAAGASIEVMQNMGAVVTNAQLTGGAVDGTLLVKASIGSLITSASSDIIPAKVPLASKQAVAGTLTQIVNNGIDNRSLLEGTATACSTSYYTAAMTEIGHGYVNRKKGFEENGQPKPDLTKHLVAKSAVGGAASGFVNRMAQVLSDPTVPKPPPVATPLYQEGIQVLVNFLREQQKELGLTEDWIDQFSKLIADLSDGEFRVYRLHFGNQAADHPMCLLVKREGDRFLCKIGQEQFLAPLLKSKL